MTITARYFGMIAEHLGFNEETIELNFVGEMALKPFFEDKYPGLAKLKYKIAIDQMFNESLEYSDKAVEVALLPPFAGG